MGLYASTDGGATWAIKSLLVNRRTTRVLVSSSDDMTVYVAGWDGIEKSTDGGNSWTTLKSGVVSDAVIDPNNDSVLYLCVHGDGVYKSPDAGATWNLLAAAPSGSAVWACRAPPTAARPGTRSPACTPITTGPSTPPPTAPDGLFDGVEFDDDLLHEDPQRVALKNRVPAEKRVALKNLHVINAPPSPFHQLVTIKFHNVLETDGLFDIVIQPESVEEAVIGLVLEPHELVEGREGLEGVEVYHPQEGEDIGRWYRRPANRRFAETGKRQEGRIVGGSTYEIRTRRARAMHPVSLIRIVLEKVQILDDKDPCIKGRGEFVFDGWVALNKQPNRRYRVRVPERGHIKISDRPGKNIVELDRVIFAGYVGVNDDLALVLMPEEQDLFSHNDRLVRYRRSFQSPPESWVGSYAPGDEPAGSDPETMADWRVWYRIESLPLSFSDRT